MTDVLEVSGPASLAALVSAAAPDQPRPLGRIVSFWLDDHAVFAVAQFDTTTDHDAYLICVQPTSIGRYSDVRRQSRLMMQHFRANGWAVRQAIADDRAIA
jgi:hypothetical protein